MLDSLGIDDHIARFHQLLIVLVLGVKLSHRDSNFCLEKLLKVSDRHCESCHSEMILSLGCEDDLLNSLRPLGMVLAEVLFKFLGHFLILVDLIH